MLLTVLGEYVLPAPGGVWQETLVGALGALDYKTQAARQALARSVDGGLADHRAPRPPVARARSRAETAEMLRTGAERIYGFGEPREWDGRWLLVVLRVPEERRDVRHQLRTRLAWAGFGSLGGGLWIIAARRARGRAARMAAGESPAAELLSFRAELGRARRARAADRRGLGARRGRRRLPRRSSTTSAALRPKTPEAVFRAQTLLVHAWRKFPFLDPDLPESVLPSALAAQARARRLPGAPRAPGTATAQDYFRSLEDGHARGRVIVEVLADAPRSRSCRRGSATGR